MTFDGVLTFGEALATIDVTDPTSPDLHIAGAELNTAVGLARLGVPVRWASRVADDQFGALVTQTLEREGIDPGGVVDAEGEKTGVIVKSRIDDHRIRSEHYRTDSAASRLTADSFPTSMLDGARWLHATGITPALGDGPRGLFADMIRRAAARGVPVSLDVNHRPQLVDDRGIRGIVDEVVGTVDTLLCNEDEARILTGTTEPESAIVELATRGPRVVVVKLGRHGALAHVDGTTLRTDAFEVPAPTFPVGAGDAFNAAWIAASLDGTSPEEALRMAAWAAACVVAHRTDHEGFPSDSAFRAARDRLRSGDLSAPGDDR